MERLGKCNPIANARIKQCNKTWQLKDEEWPTKTNAVLTLLIVLLITMYPKATLNITTSFSPLKRLITFGSDRYLNNLTNSNNYDYTSLIQSLKRVIGRRKLNVHIDTPTTTPKDMDYQIISKIHPEKIIPNKFTLTVKGSLTIYSVNHTLKHIIQAKNNLRWFNQNRIQEYKKKHIDINWALMMKLLSWGPCPLFLHTDPTESSIKNFKIKIINDKVPTNLTLHYRNPKNYLYYLHGRCKTEKESCLIY